MKRERMEYRTPYGRGDYELHRGGEGVYWRAGHGLTVDCMRLKRPFHGVLVVPDQQRRVVMHLHLKSLPLKLVFTS
jgi:hypothetical protein